MLSVMLMGGNAEAIRKRTLIVDCKSEIYLIGFDFLMKCNGFGGVSWKPDKRAVDCTNYVNVYVKYKR